MGLLQRSSKKNRTYDTHLQLTSMIDMFTVLIVFLLINYSVEPINYSASKELELPMSSENRSTENIINLIVTKNNLVVDNKKILELSGGNVSPTDIDDHDPVLIKPLFTVLNQFRIEQDKLIDESFKGKIILQADKTLEYRLLHKIIYTAGEAGYPKFKLLVMKKNQ